MRHGVVTKGVVTKYDPKPGFSVSTLAWEYAPGFQVPEHGHGSDQLIFATHGVMEVASGESLWLIPPHFGIWIPALTLHSIRMPGAVSMRTLYFRPGLTRGMPAACAVLHVTPLLRELIVHTVGIGQLSARRPLHRALREVIVAQLASASPVPVTIRWRGTRGQWRSHRR